MQRRTVISEYELLESALETFKRDSGLSIVFGGIASSTGVQVTSLRGQVTGSLAGLHVRQRRGLGGRVLLEQRPQFTHNYGRSSAITHDYDAAVLGEHVRALLAVPVIVDGQVRAVMYGATRANASFGDAVLTLAQQAAASLQHKLLAQDSLRRAAQLQQDARERAGELPAAQLEALRESYVELHAIRTEIADEQLAARLAALEQQLIRIANPQRAESEKQAVVLSPRELEVLGYVSLGWRNAEMADELGLTLSTVKSYLGAAMKKLGQTSRQAAVAAARKQGLLP